MRLNPAGEVRLLREAELSRDSIYRFTSPVVLSVQFSGYELEVLPIFIRWRLLRDVVIYYDRWWSHVDDSCTALFDGVADAILAESGCD